MKKTLRTLAASALVCAAALFTFVACSDDEETTAVVAVTGVTISPSSAQTLAVGGTLTITATVAPDNATNKAVTWKSSSTVTAEVSDAGVVTAVAAGAATITVTTVDGNKTASVGVTVNAAPDPVVPVTEVTISPSTVPALEVGGTFTLTATVSPDNATDKAVTWSSSSTITTVSSAGVVTAVAAGAANITVTTVDGNKTASVGVTVNAPEPTLDVTPTSYENVSSAGGTQDITVTGNVEWTAQASADWLELSPASGNGNGNVTITVTPYTDPVGDNVRSANVTFTAGDLTATVSVTQERSQIQATLCPQCLWDAAAADGAGAWVDGYVTDTIPNLDWDGTGWEAWIVRGATSDRDGRANTAKITALAGTAVQYCKDLGAGWYLPAYEELYNISAGTPRWGYFLTDPPTTPLNGRAGAGLLNFNYGAVFSSTEYENIEGRWRTIIAYPTYPYSGFPAATAISVTTHGEMYNEFKNNHSFVCVWRPLN